MAVCALVIASAQGQVGQHVPGDEPSVSDASVPLTYVGGNGRISLGINREGDTQGEAMGVFGNNGERAFIGQLWWGHGGMGGIQADYNWLWGMNLREARENPDKITIAKLTFAVDQNQFHDRKATAGFGIERKNYFIDAYLSGAVSGDRAAGFRSTDVDMVVQGNDDIGSYTQVQTVTTMAGFGARAFDNGIGMRAGHFSDAAAMRAFGGMDYQHGRDGAHDFTVSAGIDKYIGRRGWSVSGLVEHSESSTSPLSGANSDTRASVMLRYEFGGRGGVFQPTSEVQSPTWIPRALSSPTTAHPRTVSTYTRQTSTTTVTRDASPKQYTNHRPIAAPDSVTVPQDSIATLINVLANDSDPDGDPLSIIAVTAPAHGSATIAGDMISYTPAAGFNGVDGFSYTVSDGRGGSAEATVGVTVTEQQPNRAPIARDDAARTPLGQAVTIAILANDSDPDGDPISVTSVTQPAHGSTRLLADDSVEYTPERAFRGIDTFTYTISDSHGASASASVRVTVDPPPNQPPVARDDAASTAFDTPVTIDVLANDFDPDDDDLVVTSVGRPSNGSASLNGNDTITYTPAADFSGADTFTYRISDGHGGAANARVTVSVAQRGNRPPIANDDFATMAFADVSTVIAVLANDSDPDGDPLTVTAVTQPANGNASINGDGTVTYLRTTGLGGSDSFDYTISDGRGGVDSATVTITIDAPLNRPPVANDDVASITQGTPSIVIDVLANDSDPDGDPLTISAVTQPPFGVVSINPDNTLLFSDNDIPLGELAFTYTISDGRGGSATAAVTVTVLPPANQPPIARDDFINFPYSADPTVLDVLANDDDPDGDPLAIISVTSPGSGFVSINANGTSLTYGNGGDVGPGQTEVFTYTISDGRGGEATATVTINVVAPSNQPPVAVDDFADVIGPDGFVDIDVLANDSDPDGDPLTIIAFTQPFSDLGLSGSVELMPDNTLRYTAFFFVSQATFTYTISDGRGGTATALVTVSGD